LWETVRGAIVAKYERRQVNVWRFGGIQMHVVALEINFALWGMIICSGMRAAQFF